MPRRNFYFQLCSSRAYKSRRFLASVSPFVVVVAAWKLNLSPHLADKYFTPLSVCVCCEQNS
jgi:hypothetical protein